MATGVEKSPLTASFFGRSMTISGMESNRQLSFSMHVVKASAIVLRNVFIIMLYKKKS
jgi:hypothetical protein